MAEGFIVSENGNIKISEEVVNRITSIAAREVDGVVALGTPTGGISDFLGKKNQSKSKGIKVELGENSTEIDIHISVRFGMNICDVARKVQESVKSALESYVGMDNILINVFVDAIDIDSKAAKSGDNSEDLSDEIQGDDAQEQEQE